MILMLKRIDKQPCRSWTHLQMIKNEIIEDGVNRYALEIYHEMISKYCNNITFG